MRTGMVGFAAQRLAITLDRQVRAALVLVRDAEVVMGIGMTGIDLKSALVTTHGIGAASHFLVGQPHVTVRGGMVGVQGEGTAKMFERHIELALLLQDVAEIVMRIGILGIERQRR